jgi:GNAT superfamily N-acetyltransferase
MTVATTTSGGVSVQVRDAVHSDDAALRTIAASCPMEGDITLRVTREPDFFQLNRLEGRQWRVGVAEVDGLVVGCVMAAERRAYLYGVERRTLYAGDLKVHPRMRGAGVADALSQWVARALRDMGGVNAPILLTILAGNSAMERRTSGRGGMPNFVRFATIRAFSIPLLFPRRFTETGPRVSVATLRDVEEMVQLWERVAPTRQLAPVFTADTLERWIAGAPGLDISSYRLARDVTGRLVGFMAWWDQTPFKQATVLRYSPRLQAARAMLNGMATVTSGVKLPDAGAELKYCTAFHVCVPGGSPDVLRALVRSSYGELRAARYAFATIGLDERDPLCPALGGLFAQPTDVHAYVCTAGGDYAGPSLGDRPLHYEIALV